MTQCHSWPPFCSSTQSLGALPHFTQIVNHRHPSTAGLATEIAPVLASNRCAWPPLIRWAAAARRSGNLTTGRTSRPRPMAPAGVAAATKRRCATGCFNDRLILDDRQKTHLFAAVRPSQRVGSHSFWISLAQAAVAIWRNSSFPTAFSTPYPRRRTQLPVVLAPLAFAPGPVALPAVMAHQVLTRIRQMLEQQLQPLGTGHKLGIAHQGGVQLRAINQHALSGLYCTFSKAKGLRAI